MAGFQTRPTQVPIWRSTTTNASKLLSGNALKTEARGARKAAKVSLLD
jgi:hypothetical protein